MAVGASSRRSAASTSAACARTPCEMRLVKKPTAVNDRTATQSASSSTESSPDLRSRQRLRNAKRTICMCSIHRMARIELEHALAAARQAAVMRDQDQGAADAAIELEQ